MLGLGAFVNNWKVLICEKIQKHLNEEVWIEFD